MGSMRNHQESEVASSGSPPSLETVGRSVPKLKVMFVSLGNFRHVEPYIQAAVRRGHDVSWLVYSEPVLSVDVSTYDVSMGADPKKNSSKWRYMLSGLKARKVVRQVAPDILHGHYATSGGTVCLLSGFRPYIVTVHGSDLMHTLRSKSRIWRYLLRCGLGAAAMVNPVSDELKCIVHGLGVPEDRLVVATLGVDTSQFAFKPPSERSAATRLLCTRTLAEVYDPATIIRACRLVRDRGMNFTMTFAADGSLRCELEGLARQLGATDLIHFKGGYDSREGPSLLHEHDIYISASKWDGTSISLLEAMASGCFPVVSRIRSNQSWLEDGRSALMFEVADAQELADQLCRAMTDEALRKEAVDLNRRMVEDRGDRERNMSRVEQCYYEVLARARA